MGFLSWLFGVEDSSVNRTEEILREYRDREAERHQQYEEALRRVTEPDRELVRAMNRQLQSSPIVHPVVRASENRLQAVRNGVQALLDEILERERRKREEEARRRAEAAKSRSDDTRYSIETHDGTRFSIAKYSMETDGDGYVGSPAFNAIKAVVIANKDLGRLLVQFVNEKCDGHAAWCYQRAGVSRQLYSQIISKPDKRTSKRTVMQLAVGLQLSELEAGRLLATAGYAFSPASYEDQVFVWCIRNGVYSLFDINELLVRGGCEPVAIN